MYAKYIEAIRTQGSDEQTRTFANAADGIGVVITYTLDGWSSSDQAVLLAAMRAWSAVANVTFVAAAEGAVADVNFERLQMPGAVTGQASVLGYDLSTGQTVAQLRGDPSTVWLDTELNLKTTTGKSTVVHELGHILGLDHPHDGDIRLPSSEWKGSTMSYDGEAFYQAKPLTYDIVAIQSIYGPPTIKLGANTYKFGKDNVVYDGGGIDTLAAASSKTKVVIDLDAGSWSYANRKSSSLLKDGQMVIGHGTVIERATGSKYNDTIKGNAADNLLKGGSGNDSLDGRTGNDRLYGESGKDKLYGGWGDDLLSGGSGNDLIFGGEGADRLYGGSGKDAFKFSALSQLGTPESHDRVTDFSKSQGDRLDFRSIDFNEVAGGRQKGKFLGNSSGDYKFGEKAGEFYFNKADKALHFDADGDGVTDFVLGTNIALMSKSYFLL